MSLSISWIVAGIAGVVTVARARKRYMTTASGRTPQEVANILNRHLYGPAPGREWGNFVDGPVLTDPRLESVRRECIEKDYDLLISPEKRARVQQLIDELRAMKEPGAPS